MHIAFQTFARPVWMGGMIAFQDLMIALRSLGEDCPRLDLVVWDGTELADYEFLSPYVDGTISAKYPQPRVPPPQPIYARSIAARAKRQLRCTLFPSPPTRSIRADETLRQNHVDCSLSVPLEHRTDTSVPLLILIYDLQHHHLPHLFARHEREKRDALIHAEAQRATRLITMSKRVQADLIERFPEVGTKVRAVQWVAHIPSEVYATNPHYVRERYHLPEKFFYLPNQFWMHKNHTIVIQALQILASRNVYPCVVCTGNLVDHRDPEYIGSLLNILSVENLREQFVILGTVPRADVFALMRQSVAVLNPSLFEGFGLSAAEAHSLGKRALLADLPSLREQEPSCALYFNPKDSLELADKMELLWRTIPAGPDAELEAEAQRALPRRQYEFANSFLYIAREGIAASRHSLGLGRADPKGQLGGSSPKLHQ